MAPEGHLSYSADPNIRARRTTPCSVRVRIDPIPPKGSPRLPTCPSQSWFPLVVMPSGIHGHAVRTQPIGTSRGRGRCTNWEISPAGVHGILSSPSRNPIGRNVRRTSRLLWRSGRHRAVSTPPACSIWRGGSWSRTAYPPAQRVGPCGAPIAVLCPWRPCRTGVRLGGKRRRRA